jgi:hypothetical protein
VGGGASLTKPVTGALPAQQVSPQGPPQSAQQPLQQPGGPQQGSGPAGATMPATGAGQAVPPGSVTAPAVVRGLQQQPPPQAPSQQQAQQQAQQQGASQQAGRPAKGRGNRGPRRARLQLRHIDTWSALKISLVLSIALFFIWMVAVGILYGVLSGLGVFDTLNDLFGQIGTSSGGEGGSEVITPGIVFGGAAVIGAVNIVLMTALATVAAFIYNLCADLVGGLEVTLAERD